ncbi:MAG TPA: YdeI/OmpD-associated family protein [Polyangiaceae bacterium]
MPHAKGRHVFTTKLESDGSGMSHVVVPASVSKAIGRGKAPVEARIGRGPPFRGTFMPAGGGRHRLFVSKATRRASGVEPGDRVRVAATIDDGNRDVPVPPDVRDALIDAGVLGAWEGMPPGKREHILAWVEKAAHEATREKRIARSVEEALKVHERKLDATKP